jgi:hypothetical protein
MLLSIVESNTLLTPPSEQGPLRALFLFWNTHIAMALFGFYPLAGIDGAVRREIVEFKELIQ